MLPGILPRGGSGFREADALEPNGRKEAQEAQKTRLRFLRLLRFLAANALRGFSLAAFG